MPFPLKDVRLLERHEVYDEMDYLGPDWWDEGEGINESDVDE
jgi:hypothetical protein